jgi:hypothetical protein
MANAANLINFGGGGSLAIGDWTYSAYPLTAPSYLPLNNDTASYLTSSYPALGAIYAPTTVAYSAAAVTLPATNYNGVVYNVVFGNGIFMAYTANGALLTSPDGTNWSPLGMQIQAVDAVQNTGSSRYGQMAYGNGKFVIVRNALLNPTTTVGYGCSLVTLDNGATWQIGGLPTNSPSVLTAQITWTNIVYTGSVFVALGWRLNSVYRNVTSYSADGFVWSEPIDSGSSLSSNPPTSACIGYGSGTIVISGSEAPGGVTRSSYSTDNGATWSGNIASIPNGSAPTSIAYGAGIFVLLLKDDGTGSGTPTSTYYTSPTGVTWTSRALPATLRWRSVTFANGYFVAVGFSGSAATTSIYTSVDGINWVARTVPSTASGVSRNSVAGGGGKFVYTVGNWTGSSGVLINLDTASANFSLPYIRPIAGTQAFIKAT